MTGRAAWLIVLLFVCAGCGRDSESYKDAIETTLGGVPAWVDSRLGKRLWEIERRFYAARGHLPAWTDGGRNTPHLKALIEEFRYSQAHGLDPAGYPLEEYERIHAEAQTFFGERFDPDQVPELDVRLTYGYLRYAADLLGWSEKPRGLWLTQPNEEDLAGRLAAAIEASRIRESLEALAPAHPQYKGLAAALARERRNPTGQADRIRLNMERWRWMPRDFGDRYVLINVPAYGLQVMEDEHPVLAMRVVVGKRDTPTPLFSDELAYLAFSPYWNIPESILRKETIPRAAQDPDFLERSNIEVVGTSGAVDPSSIDWADPSIASTIRLRQRPGPDNALGLVKFILPNNFSIYLHDTPDDRLFSRDKRAFSHGCIRLEDPVGLAEYVLRDYPGWTTDRILAAMHAGREQHVQLTRPLRVYIGYWTAWVEADGSVTFTDDPYGLDDAQMELVKGTRSMPAGSRLSPKSS